MDTWLLRCLALSAFAIVLVPALPFGGARAQAIIGNACLYGQGAGPVIQGLNTSGGTVFSPVTCQSSNTWGYPIVTLQSAAAAGGSSCTGYAAGALRFNSTLGIPEFCDGTSWDVVGLGASIYLGSSAIATNPHVSGDAGTGLFTPTGSTIAIATGGTERLRVSSSGYVGIGSTSPVYQLDDYGTGAYLRVGTPATELVMNTNSLSSVGTALNLNYAANQNIVMQTGGSTGLVGIGTTTPQSTLGVSGGVAIGTTYAGTNAAGSNNLIVQGNVGIGTASPSDLLHVYGSLGGGGLYLQGAYGSGAGIRISRAGTSNNYQVKFQTSGTTQWVIGNLGQSNENFGFYIGTSSVAAVTIGSSGNVGIGTTTPQMSLDLSQRTDGVGLPEAAASAGSSCTNTGEIRYNTTIGAVEVCSGTTWNAVGAVTAGCGAVSGLSFTDVTNATLNTVYTSNSATITFTGCAGALSVSVSGGGSPQISVNGGTWSTSGAIYSGQTLQTRLTSSGSVSTGLTDTVTVGTSSTANWTVTTRSGALQVFTTPGTYTSNLGGLSGADSICQAAASAAGYAGTWKAILSDDTTSAASRLTLSYPIVNAYDGSTVAATNLWNATSAGIKTPSGGSALWNNSAYNNLYPVWTGTNSDGSSAVGYTCNNWTSVSGSYSVGVGDDQAGTGWVASGQITNCSSAGSQPLYCIQQ